MVKLNAVNKQIQITLALPEDAQDSSWVRDLQNWLEHKLTFELKRTEEHIQAGFNGCLQWVGKPVVFRTETAEQYEKKLPPAEVIDLLEHETAHVLDWKDAAGAAQERFSSRKGGVLLIKGEAEQGSAQFFNHLALLLRCRQDSSQPLQHFVSMELGKSDSYDWSERLTAEITRRLFSPQHVCACSANEMLASFGKKAEELDMFCVVLLKDFDQMIPQARKEVAAALSAAEAAAYERLFFIINTGEQIRGAECFELPAVFSEEDMIRYFEKQGLYGDKAKQKAAQLKEMQDIDPCADKMIKYSAILMLS